MVVKRKVPIRFGIVPVIDSPNRKDQAKVIYHLWDTYGLAAVFAYLELVSRSLEHEVYETDIKVVHGKRGFCERSQGSF